MKTIVEEWMKGLQDRICSSLEELDGRGRFLEDLWTRKQGGGGRTRIITGKHIEKGGVNFSAVHGPMPMKIKHALDIEVASFYATGVSIVLHPRNPHIPIIHMNVRYFETDRGLSWFGGGIDLTPHIIDVEDAVFFHRSLKDVCDSHDSQYYYHFKDWADKYFYIKHRKESRGIGGIFFDRLSDQDGYSMADRWRYVQSIGESFVPIYSKIFNKHKEDIVSDEEREFFYHRRGRYVEFNLVWDKGTKFGLDTDGRIESILMSMPPLAKWTYEYQVVPESKMQLTQKILNKAAIKWV